MKRCKNNIIIGVLAIIFLIGYMIIDLENKNIKQFITQSSFYKNAYTPIEIKILKLMYEKQILSFSDNLVNYKNFYSGDYNNPESYIAHGGGIEEFTYTNSKEALLDSLEKGFRFIEIDMCVTTDRHIIGCHDWRYFKKITGLKNIDHEALSLNEVKKLHINNKYNVLTGNEIANIMKENLDFICVTDKIRDYSLLIKEIPFPERLIVEVFSVKDYLSALMAGIKHPAYCIWAEHELEIARAFKFPIVTIGEYFFQTGNISAVKELHDAGVTILFFHGGAGDNATFLQKHLGKSFSKVYTNKWSPINMPSH